MNYPALSDGASRFIDTLTPGIPRVFHPASQRRSHPRASPLRSMGKVPPSSKGLEAQISLFVTQKCFCKGLSIPHLTGGDFRPLNPHRVKVKKTGRKERGMEVQTLVPGRIRGQGKIFRKPAPLGRQTRSSSAIGERRSKAAEERIRMPVSASACPAPLARRGRSVAGPVLGKGVWYFLYDVGGHYVISFFRNCHIPRHAGYK